MPSGDVGHAQVSCSVMSSSHSRGLEVQWEQWPASPGKELEAFQAVCAEGD